MNQLMILADIDIAGVPFRLQYRYGKEKNELTFSWQRPRAATMGLSGLSAALQGTPLGFSVPEQLDGLGILLSAIMAQYDFKSHAFTFSLAAEGYGSLTAAYIPRESGDIWKFILEMKARFLMSRLPVFGSGFGADDYVGLREFSLQLSRTAEGREEFAPSVSLIWKLQGKETLLTLPEPAPGKDTVLAEPAGNQPKYLDVNKDFGVFRLSRVGFAMGNQAVTLYVDAGIRLSVLLLEFIGLHLDIPLSAGKKPGFGLQGAAVSLSKAPLYISGGLVLDKSGSMTLYTGEVSVRFRELGVTALCSYGQFAEGDPSLFAFFLLSANLGGPPVFFITGLAGGFGYNRSITLPEKVEEVEKFPFVAAAMGKGDLKKGMTPSEVLTHMNQAVQPCREQYFFSAGIRFRSFGILESFLLCNVEFGRKFRISILGVSELALPSGAQNPLVLIRLALKAVFAPDDGIISIEGALLSGSYILDKNCRVNGGFACYIWFGKSEHAGDFVITLGGYRNGYSVAHYPKVDRLGINWKMDDHLSLTADAYFALTPSCVMLGGNLCILYENGRIKAWFKAWAEFFMQWAPFCYEISVGISLGASYRWDFFPFYRTFKVELGADLKLWGPPFGGEVHISWFIISFTIHFGKGKPQGNSLKWKEFADTFLPEKTGNAAVEETRDSTAHKVISIQPAEGMLISGEKTGVYVMNAEALELEITSQVMSSEVCYENTAIAKYPGTLGIVPMGITALHSGLTIKLTDQNGQPVENLSACPIYTSAPKALWNDRTPGREDTENLLPDVPCGIRLTSKDAVPRGILPKTGSYDMEVLCANEKLGPHYYSYPVPTPVEGKTYPADHVLEQVEKSIAVRGGVRKEMLAELEQIFGVWKEDELLLTNWEKGLDRQLSAEPILKVIGADT